MKYDPNNELTEEQMEALSQDEFFEYLDTKAEYLKQFTKPLSSYHTKRYASIAAAISGKQLTHDEFKTATKIGKENEQKAADEIADRLGEYEKNDPKYRDEGIKNIKTHRSQWFD